MASIKKWKEEYFSKEGPYSLTNIPVYPEKGISRQEDRDILAQALKMFRQNFPKGERESLEDLRWEFAQNKIAEGKRTETFTSPVPKDMEKVLKKLLLI